MGEINNPNLKKKKKLQIFKLFYLFLFNGSSINISYSNFIGARKISSVLIMSFPFKSMGGKIVKIFS